MVFNQLAQPHRAFDTAGQQRHQRHLDHVIQPVTIAERWRADPAHGADVMLKTIIIGMVKLADGMGV